MRQTCETLDTYLLIQVVSPLSLFSYRIQFSSENINYGAWNYQDISFYRSIHSIIHKVYIITLKTLITFIITIYKNVINYTFDICPITSRSYLSWCVARYDDGDKDGWRSKIITKSMKRIEEELELEMMMMMMMDMHVFTQHHPSCNIIRWYVLWLSILMNSNDRGWI